MIVWNPLLRFGTLYLVLNELVNAFTGINTYSATLKRRSHHRLYSSAYGAEKTAELPTAYEWIAEERLELCGGIQWIDPSKIEGDEIEKLLGQLKKSRAENLKLQRVPVCPIDSVFVSGGKDQLLNFVSKRNIKMVQDLRDGVYGPPRFCAVLQALDTNRVASVGIMLNIVGMREMKAKESDEIAGVIIKVVPEDNVSVLSFENPKAWEPEQRLLGSDAYLIAEVQHIESDKNEDEGSKEEIEKLSKELADDFSAVRAIYLDKNGVVIRDLPDFDIVTFSWQLPDAEVVKKRDYMDESTFWKGLEQWQDLCYAARKAYKAKNQVKSLEMCVEASLATFGKMKYPIDREAYPLEYQKAIKSIEDEGAKEYACLETIDPVLTLQGVLSAPSHLDRLKLLHKVISSERKRLEDLMG